MIESRFGLTTHNGDHVTERDFLGFYLLVYFGFTNCKVVCPRSLAKLSSALDRVGELSARVKPLYVTVDPARDTPAAMKAYLEVRFPRFTGLTGSEEEIKAAKSAFRVFAERKGLDDDYTVPHTAIAYLMSPTGSYLDHFPDSVDEETVVDRMTRLIQSVS